MADQTAPQADKRTASQRIEDLERALMSLYQTADNMARDLLTVKEAIKLLGNKVDSIAKAANISDDTISKLMIANNVAELTEKTTNLVAQGILVASDEVSDNSFVVGQEVNEAGEVVNPRIQFTLGSLQPEIREKIKAGKKGEPIELQAGKLRFIITESYAIVAPQAQPVPVQAEEAPAEPQAEASASEGQSDAAPAESAPQAPAAEQSSSNESAPQASADQEQAGN